MSYLSRVPTDLEVTVERLRAQGGDATDIEAKAAAGGLPESIGASLCAFANLPGGGLIILGLDERLGFAPVRLSDIQSLKQGLVGKARACEPPVQLRFVDAHESLVDGAEVVAAFVAECDPSLKPCRVASTKRAWIRGWDGDYTMSELEERAFLSQRGQPHVDREPVLSATRDDLDPELVTLWSATARGLDRQGLGRFEGDELLIKAGIVTGDGVPTVAGMLALGRQPQQFFPRFVVNLSAEPLDGSSNVRARNLASLSGPIPLMLDAALEWARQTFSRTVVTEADGAVRDHFEYPLEAFRELICNALVHRDLAPWSQGDAVEVRLRRDRLVIMNPGGLYGISVDRLGREGTTSARNARLLEVCKYTRAADGARVVETLATGIPRVIAAVSAAHLPEPRFHDAGIGFTVVLRGSAISALQSTGTITLSGSAALVTTALAAGPKSTATLVSELGLSVPNVRKILRRLIEKRVVRRDGGPGKPTQYSLNRDGPRGIVMK